ncbi:pyridoxamine 5'-phosphate oxidase family protein [Streptomyces purpureus]|uniref:Pyridoxamine 5'-phosphate oxidase N-terminal domain-containing protein n=1 Tax=Streptomyces purpureus TaxID=1951 RepID=A0A918HIK7_9ACTN|nr:pyridoxamine 5'-phosphate oxidase family protein [Streptomyces purpureus]GGT61375.1 hypothetical protein GCM10014713_63540 [Streptomyces purpureus]
MTTYAPARSREQRIQDVLARLEKDKDVWVATASAGGEPYLTPLSFVWDQDSLLMATKRVNATVQNIAASGEIRLSLGHTRDVVLIEATARLEGGTELAPASADAFAAKFDWDPRDREAWVYIRATPRTVRAWREVNELAGRLLMRDGRWLPVSRPER